MLFHTSFSQHSLTLFRMDFFGAAQRCGGGGAKIPPPLHTTSQTYIVIAYLKKIQIIFDSRDTPLEFC